MVNVTLENPLQLLGKTSLRALLYLWKCFYRKTEIDSKNSSNHKLQLITISVLELHLENRANQQTAKTEIFTTINSIKCCMSSLEKCAQNLLSLFLDFCAFLLLYDFSLECMPINVAALLHFLTAQKFSPCSLFSFSQMLMKEWMIFSSSLLLLFSKWPFGLP